MRLLRSGARCTSLILLCCILAGCGSTPTITLVTCKVTNNETVYYYDTYGNYYWKKPGEDLIYPISNIGLKPEPILNIQSSITEYNLTEVEATRYTGNLNDVIGYINTLTSSGYSIEVDEATPVMLDIHATNEENKVRIIYLLDDVVRIYSVNKYGSSCVPPYLK